MFLFSDEFVFSEEDLKNLDIAVSQIVEKETDLSLIQHMHNEKDRLNNLFVIEDQSSALLEELKSRF